MSTIVGIVIADEFDSEDEITEIPVKPVTEPVKEAIREPKPLDIKDNFSLIGNDNGSVLIYDGPVDYLFYQSVAEIVNIFMEE
ncbi:17465_t:CDS:2 [Cetraspora pellucida]|uniref:17465_t:CDS:1 n=1 Tax=Cetraspora pellucida TaxID=1433469 RepID=A0A9N9BFN4_9GLOM|nr:17465_t:CDS:2 [Cetraspora pellucida]